MQDSDMGRLKPAIVQAVLNHPNNKDPDWIREFREASIPCPVYTESALTAMGGTTINTIAAAWHIETTLDDAAQRKAIFEHIFNKFEISDSLEDDGHSALFNQNNNHNRVELTTESIFQRLENSGRERGRNNHRYNDDDFHDNFNGDDNHNHRNNDNRQPRRRPPMIHHNSAQTLY